MTTLRRWRSTSGQAAGDELISRPLLPTELKAALRPALQSGNLGGAFLIARLGSSDHSGICAAIRAVDELNAPVHIALAVDFATLTALDGSLPVSEGIGLVLDGVDATTPLSGLILDSIEAVRFEAAFTNAASRSLRVDAALRAMLFLANDLALGTFGSGPASSSGSLSPGPMFDYVLRDEAAPIVVRGPKTQPTTDTDWAASRRAV